ncbi:ribosome assembly cofactor RimP [Luteirhabdus pelagi]|uniref:ribosome assembly cofactor RimP n=1 Tax=Luteirhabdus pelagi TaxID=2792783 RepID=UPI001939922E|nr:ribosome assembly cofactor RimP [Luteirhabdus pelagi]
MKERVKELIDKALHENPSLFLLDFTVTDDNRIKVIVDGDQGVTVEDCIQLSRAIEHNLDREEEDFSLDVMSAGVSEPLQMPRQYKKNVGRKLKVTTTDNQEIEATLSEATDEAITLNWKVREPKPVGKGKHTVKKEAILPYGEIEQAKVKITFNK